MIIARGGVRGGGGVGGSQRIFSILTNYSAYSTTTASGPQPPKLKHLVHSPTELGANLVNELKSRLIFRPTLSKLREQAASAPRIKETPPFEALAASPRNAELLRDQLSFRVTDMDLNSIGLAENLDGNVIRQILSLELSSQPEINKFNRQQAIAYFSRVPNDTGSPEVQAGILTVRIAYLAQHASFHKHDYKAIRLITQLVHERKHHLKYLHRISLPRFYQLLDKLGLPPDYLDSFANPYLYKYRKPRQAK